MPQSRDNNSILTKLGNEVTNIVTPVTICMVLTVILVRLLNPKGESGSSAVLIATTVYKEQASDTDANKLFGSVLNALVFVGVICAMTFVLFILFKYGCVKVIYVYMGFAIFSIFFFFLGAITVEVLQVIGWHIDAVSLVFILYNTAVVGMLGLFFWPAPLFVRQCYLVMVGVLVAYVFTWIPEWTTWVLLVAMALYDLCAVLCPHGPLRAIVELAQEREQDIPALVFEARPVQRDNNGNNSSGDVTNNNNGNGSNNQQTNGNSEQQQLSTSSGTRASQRGPVGEGIETELALVVGMTNRDSVQQTNGQSSSNPRRRQNSTSNELGQQIVRRLTQDGQEQSNTPKPPLQTRIQRFNDDEEEEEEDQREDSNLVGTPLIQGSQPSDSTSPQEQRQQASSQSQEVRVQVERTNADIVSPAEGQGEGQGEEEGQSWGLPDAIKLGLGDFIFYSVLVGRAAMYDLMTVYAGYIAIIAGLVMTLLLLAIYKRALPALPISIALGMVFYFTTRLVLQPFVVGCTTNLVAF
eukprot:TRINITY_DN39938_c0_g1_i2.p1 TRINITY_DN39938_c0_g1~~TRINITY_DN39938_c0_g1_i2.p1  ORF type:complete len:524 (+),score=93.78 TRINITY_DN39938_c0_g1_i2:873-2444(+)